MKKKNYIGRCEKRTLSKCQEVCRVYSEIQDVYLNVLQNNNDIKEFQCNVPITLTEGEYTSDFVCVKINGDIMVRECVQRKLLMKPMTAKLLDSSKEYWKNRGVIDWGVIIDVEK